MSDDDMSSESEYEEELIEEADETDLMELEPPTPKSCAEQRKFQKDQWINQHLPYASELDAEADAQFAVIKAGVGHALMLREIRPSLLHWACELDKFISLHGRRFSKAEHIQLVKAFYSVLLIPQLEFRMLKTFSHVVCILLEKREMLSPADLQLDWRPLYDLYVLVTFKNMEEDGTMLLPENISQSLEMCIGRCRPYFRSGATREVLAAQRPYLCPWDVSMLRGVSCLAMLLPTTLTAEEHSAEGCGLWFPEAMRWYASIQNCPMWEPKWFALFARLAKDSPGAVDFRPHYGLIFGRLIRSFGLHLGSGLTTGRVLVGSGSKHFDWDTLTLWLAYQLGGDDAAVQGELESLFAALESYFHPSNTGKHSERLLNFLYRLARQLCLRLHRERHKSPDWTPPVPPHLRLTDAHVEKFVKMVLPCAVAGIFSKVRQDISSAAIRVLALLSPRVVIPAVLEKLYGALETLTEPHRLLNSLAALNACLIPLVRDGTPWDTAQRDAAKAAEAPPPEAAKRRPKRKAEEEAPPSLRLHVVPLLNALLPALDPNDISKAMLAFQALSLIVALVPLVDASEGLDEVAGLTGEERELASATATLEDWVGQLLERVFALLRNMADGQGNSLRKSKGTSTSLSLEENYIKMGLSGIFRALLTNSSTAIYRVVVDTLRLFLKDNIFDSQVACDTLSEMLYGAVRVDPDYTLPIFLPIILHGLRSHITPETKGEDEVDASVLWWLVVSKGLVRTDGRALLRHKADIWELVELTQGMRCKQAYEIGHQLLEFLLSSLTSLFLLNHAARRHLLDSAPKDYFVIRHWGAPTKRKDVKVAWHVPSAEEAAFATELLERFLGETLSQLDAPDGLSPEEVLRAMSQVGVCLTGAGGLLPQLESPLLNLVPDFLVAAAPFDYVTRPGGLPPLQLPAAPGNVRNRVLQTLRGLLVWLLSKREDDTKSLISIAKLYHILIFHFGIYKWKYDKQVKTFNYSKKAVGDIVRGKKSVLESVFSEFALIAHHKRLLEQRSAYYFTEAHRWMMEDLLRLSTSAYSAVRREGQSVLQMCTNMFPYCYKWILDPLLASLKESPEVTHEQFKGALYVLGGGKSKALVVRQNWPTLAQLWPALIRAQHSEKPSIIAMFDELQNTVVDNLESFQIDLQIPDSVAEAGAEMWAEGEQFATPAWPPPSPELVAKGLQQLRDRNERNIKLYRDIIEDLVSLSNDSNLHWRHADMAQSLLSLMIRKDQVFPVNAIETMVKLLVHDTLKTRKMVISFFTAWLKITKPRPKKIPYRFPKGVSPVLSSEESAGSAWGYREDNVALMWRDASVPRTEAAWNATQFVEQTHWGFACWPADFTTYAAPPEQPKWNRGREELKATEAALFDALQSPDYVRRLVTFLSIEEKKGEDTFQSIHYAFFKGLFRLFGDGCLASLRPILEAMLGSEKEGEQRLGSEMVAGLIQGSKLWPFPALESLWAWLGPLLEETWASLTSETNRNWGTCVATALNSRDPRRLRWLIEAARNVARRPVEGSFHLSNRLYVFQGALNQMEWRVPELWREMMSITLPIVAQPYQNVRSRLGSCFSTIVWFDLPDMKTEGLGKQEAVARVDEILDLLYEGIPNILKEIQLNTTKPEAMDEEQTANGFVSPQEDPVRKEEVLRLKTTLSFLNSHWSHGYVSVTPGILRLLPVLAYFENETADEELKRDALYQRLYLGKAEMFPGAVPAALAQVEAIAARPWWKSKLSALRYLQVSVFSNLFLWKPVRARVLAVVEGLLGDARLEVRETAGETLSGLFHCGFVGVTEELSSHYAQLSGGGPEERQAGVLGLAAVVAAFPYSVPPFLPATLMALSRHAAAPEPIRAAVRKCLAEFKRTHYDSWQEHKEEFTEDQLAVLTDLLVSPSYYV